MSEWISVATRPPEGRCLVFIPDDETQMHTAHYHPNVTIIGNHFEFDMRTVTHWQPLPLPPTTTQD